jgi:hypothetical protein
MDRIDAVLHNGPGTKLLHPAIKHALTFARKLIDKYYTKTDLSNIYRIAMSESFFASCYSHLADIDS